MIYIPERFKEMIDKHLVGNYVPLDSSPLILSIIGPPGMGKTYQLRAYLRGLRIKIITINSADLENEKAGEPAKLLRAKYKEASLLIENGTPTVLLIDDVDTTLGEWKNNTGTVNHQTNLAFLMHIADDPSHIDNDDEYRRVPIFFTGNYFDRLYEPLVRAGRVIRFDWEPEPDEKIKMIMESYGISNYELVKSFVEMNPKEKVSYYTSLLRSTRLELMLKTNDICISRVLGDENYKRFLLEKYNNISYEQALIAYMTSDDSDTTADPNEDSAIAESNDNITVILSEEIC